MPQISVDNPCLYLTSVTHNRLPVFRTDRFKKLLIDSFDEARRSASFLIFAYVVMLDHYHVITDSGLKPSKVLQFLNGISARRVINYLKEEGPELSLSKLRTETKDRDYKYSLWEHHPNKFTIHSEAMMLQKLHYIHQNPVEEGLVENPADYQYSSARYWLRSPLLDREPLEVDLKKLEWRRSL